MAKYNNGVNGPFSGKIGPVVGSSWKGIPYMKSRPIRSKKATEGELANRARFKIAQTWLSPLLDFVRIGFKGYTPTWEGFVAAKSYLMKNAMEGRGAETTINPALMKVSFGDLALSKNIAVQLTDNNTLRFTWDTEMVATGMGSPRDQVILLAYDIENEIAKYYIAGEFRKKGADTMTLPDHKGTTWHIYAAFVAYDRSRQSDSVYLGEIKI